MKSITCLEYVQISMIYGYKRNNIDTHSKVQVFANKRVEHIASGLSVTRNYYLIV